MASERNSLRFDAAVATLVGFLALIVSAYTAYEQHLQVRAQVWPILEIAWSNGPISSWVTNKGPGPAIVRDVKVVADGRPMHRWGEIAGRLGGDGNHNIYSSALNHRVLSAGERVDWFIARDEKGADIMENDGKTTWADAVYEARARLSIDVCYCSTLDECWLLSVRQRRHETHSVRRCPASSGDSFDD